MGLIANNVFSGIADRLAGQAQQLKAAINSGQNTGTKLYPRIHTGVPTNGDFEVENALINSANDIDTNSISGSTFRATYTSFLQDLETHVLNNNADSFDSWLNTSGLNVHEDFEDIWFQVKGTRLDSRNVFFPDENILAASYAALSSGTGTFTAGTDVGTGSGKVSSTNYAAAKMVLVPVND